DVGTAAAWGAGALGKCRDVARARRMSVCSRVCTAGADSLAPTAAGVNCAWATACAGAEGADELALALATRVARGREDTTISGRALAAAPPTTATVEAVATTLVNDTAVAVVPLPSEEVMRCGKARNVIHSANGRRPV